MYGEILLPNGKPIFHRVVCNFYYVHRNFYVNNTNFIYNLLNHSRIPVFTNSEGIDVPFWKKINPDAERIDLLEINKVNQMSRFPYEERYQFWQSLQLKHNY